MTMPTDFSHFDVRRYETLPVRKGYREWVVTYEDTVLDEMDLRLLEGIGSFDVARVKCAADLACGTGRIGAWLAGAGVAVIDGVDITPEMLERARDKEIYRTLRQADVAETGLPDGEYDLVIQVLADEHLPDLRPLYREAARLAIDAGRFVIVGYHPHFLMSGIPTHFDRPSGESVAIASFVHQFGEHVRAATEAGWTLRELNERLIDEDWIARKPKWERYRHHPVSYVMVWEGRD